MNREMPPTFTQVGTAFMSILTLMLVRGVPPREVMRYGLGVNIYVCTLMIQRNRGQL